MAKNWRKIFGGINSSGTVGASEAKAEWLKSESAVDAFLALFTGENFGKMVVKF